MLGTQKDLYQKLTDDGRKTFTATPTMSLDAEMCNILIAETNKLKGHVATLGQTLGWRENELKQMKKKLRDTDLQMRDMQNELDESKIESGRVERISKDGERANFQPSELTSKSTLRRFVDELNKECGK